MVLRLFTLLSILINFSTSKAFSSSWEEAGIDLWGSFISEKIPAHLQPAAENFVRDCYRQVGEEVNNPKNELGRMAADQKEIWKALQQNRFPEIRNALEGAFVEIVTRANFLQRIAEDQNWTIVHSHLARLHASAAPKQAVLQTAARA